MWARHHTTMRTEVGRRGTEAGRQAGQEEQLMDSIASHFPAPVGLGSLSSRQVSFTVQKKTLANYLAQF